MDETVDTSKRNILLFHVIFRYTFLAFGQGPRACIGVRFAVLEIKMAFFSLISQFDITACPDTPKEILINPKRAVSGPLTPIICSAIRRS